jgi:hypothetical protein
LIFYKYYEEFDIEDEPIMLKEENEEATTKNKQNKIEMINLKI